MIDRAALKAADAALGIADLTAACAALNAQTKQLTSQPITWSQIKLLARTSATGDWSRIVARARQTPNLPPSTPTDAAVLAAINAAESADTDVIDPTNEAVWTAFQAGMTALQASGDLSAATAAAISGLPNQTVPTWAETITVGLLQTVRAGL